MFNFYVQFLYPHGRTLLLIIDDRVIINKNLNGLEKDKGTYLVRTSIGWERKLCEVK